MTLPFPFFLFQSYLHVNVEDIYLRFEFGLVQAKKKTAISFPNGWRRVLTPVFNTKGGQWTWNEYCQVFSTEVSPKGENGCENGARVGTCSE